VIACHDPRKSESKTVIAEGLKIGLPAAEGTLPAFTTTGVAVSKKDGSVYVFIGHHECDPAGIAPSAK